MFFAQIFFFCISVSISFDLDKALLGLAWVQTPCNVDQQTIKYRLKRRNNFSMVYLNFPFSFGSDKAAKNAVLFHVICVAGE